MDHYYHFFESSTSLCALPTTGENLLERFPAGKRKVSEFAELTCTASTYEVCRLFLAALQLANSGNVEIIPGFYPPWPPTITYIFLSRLHNCCMYISYIYCDKADKYL